MAKGGDKLRERLERTTRSLGSAKAVRVGFMENARYPTKRGQSVAMVAAINEYGAPSRGQPPRPFFREMIKERSPGWPAAIAAQLKESDYDANRTLTIVGLAVVGQLKEKINTYVGPPLKPATIRRKGFSKQLIDTSFMLNSAASKVVMK